MSATLSSRRAYAISLALVAIGVVPTWGLQASVECALPIAKEDAAALVVDVWTAGASTPATLRVSAEATSQHTSIARVTLACDEDLRLVLRSTGLVSEVVTLRKSHCADVRLMPRIFRATRVYGRVLASDPLRGRRGSLSLARCRAARSADARLSDAYPLSIGEGGAWSSMVPAECIDLALTLPEYAPLSWEALRLAPADVTNLGSRVLAPVATATVAAAGPTAPVHKADVYLVQESRAAAELSAVLEGRRPELEVAAVTGVDGRALMTNLAPGIVRFVVLADGFAPQWTAPVEIEPGSKVAVPIVLQKPGALNVTVHARQAASLTDITVNAVPLFEGRTLPGVVGLSAPAVDSATALAGLSPGPWRVTASRTTNGLIESLGSVDVEVRGNARTAVTLDLVGTLFSGYVTAHGKAVSGGRVELLRVGPILSERRSAQVDADGTFEVALREPGGYNVIYYEDDRWVVKGLALDVSFVGPGLVTEVAIAENVVSGTVVDSEGEAVRDAKVRLTYNNSANRSGSVERMVRSDQQGQFRIEGVPRGQWYLQASDDVRASNLETLSIDRSSSRPVRLVLEETSDLTGHVLTATGEPVAFVSGYLFFEDSLSPTLTNLSEFKADATGRFTVTLPMPRPQYVHVQVLAGERGLALFRRALSERIEVRLPEATGTLTLRFPRTGQLGEGAPALHCLINEAGAMMYLNLALDGGRSGIVTRSTDMTSVTLPFLAPGTWRLIPFTAQDRVPWFLYGRSAPAPVAEFTLLPGERRAVLVQ